MQYILIEIILKKVEEKQFSLFLTNLTKCCAISTNLSHSMFIFTKPGVKINPFILSIVAGSIL